MTESATPPRNGFTLSGWHVLAMVVGFFSVVVGVDTTFAVLAVRTHPGQVSVTPHEDGLLYNRRLAQLDAQEKLGWKAAATAAPEGVAMTFVDRRGTPLTGLSLSGRLERPATEAGRMTLRFVETTPGRYLARTAATGAWDLTAEATDRRGHDFIAERRLTWP